MVSRLASSKAKEQGAHSEGGELCSPLIALVAMTCSYWSQQYPAGVGAMREVGNAHWRSHEEVPPVHARTKTTSS